MRLSKRVFVTICALVALSISSSSFAATLTKVNDDVFAPLRTVTPAKKVRLDKLPLYGSRSTPIDLEEFQVWAPDGKIFVHDGSGNVQKLDPPAMRFFRGQVNGDPESFAYFSIELKTGKITGMVATKDDNFAIDAVTRRVNPQPRNRSLTGGGDGGSGYDYLLTSTNANDMNMPAGTSWQCDVEQHQMTPPTLRHTQTDAKGLPIQSQALSGSQHYSIRLEIETDDELYANAGSIVGNETTYVTNLTGALSTIYNRDLKTDVILVGIHTHTGGPGTDQWTQATSTSLALYEFGTYYHNNPGYQIGAHSSAVFLSGKNLSGGIAWEGVICNADFFCGATGANCGDPASANQYGGSYAWCGLIGVGGFGSIPDPNATTNGALYGMPTGTQNYWPLVEYAHELGHNMAGHHTHCVAITDVERTASGFTDGSAANSTSNFIDHCFASEGAGCFSGTDYVLGSQTVNRGTIMSYCQNVFNGGVPQSRFVFGLATEPTHHELDDYMFTATPIISTGNIITNTSAVMNSMTAPLSVAPNSTGNAASISVTNGSTYNWTITGGTITAGQGTTAITFTAGASGSVVLKANAYGTNNCGITDTRSVTITSVTYNPPTNVVATAISSTTVSVTWVVPASGTTPGQYNVYRTSDNINYSSVGNSTSTSFNDTTAAANTAYLYKVRSAALGGANESADSNRDLANTVMFTNPTLTAGTSVVKAVDLTELRAAVDKVRTLNGIGAGFYTNGTITASVSTIQKIDIDELRTNLNTPLTNMGLPTPTYTNSTLTAGSSLVKAVDFVELRNATK